MTGGRMDLEASPTGPADQSMHLLEIKVADTALLRLYPMALSRSVIPASSILPIGNPVIQPANWALSLGLF